MQSRYWSHVRLGSHFSYILTVARHLTCLGAEHLAEAALEVLGRLFADLARRSVAASREGAESEEHEREPLHAGSSGGGLSGREESVRASVTGVRPLSDTWKVADLAKRTS